MAEMPFVRLETDAETVPENEKAIARRLSEIVSEETCKPARYVMVSITRSAMMMPGGRGPAAFVEVKSIGGLDSAVNGRVAASVTEALSAALDLSPDRIYVTFTDVPGENWAWRGETFR